MNNHGLAAIAIIEKDIETAARLYRETLSPDHQIEVDALQKIHAMHNLQFVIKKLAEADKAGVSNIMRDEELRRLAEQEKQFSENFLIKFRVRQDESRYLLERLGDELESAELHVRNSFHELYMKLLTALNGFYHRLKTGLTTLRGGTERSLRCGKQMRPTTTSFCV
jgi:hypothetical protein